MSEHRIDVRVRQLDNAEEIDWQRSAARLSELASAVAGRTVECAAHADASGTARLSYRTDAAEPSDVGEDTALQQLIDDAEAWVVRVREGQPFRQAFQNPDGSTARVFTLVASVASTRDAPEQWSSEAYEIITHEGGATDRVPLDLGKGDVFESMFAANITVGQRLNDYYKREGLMS